jgi:Xaa-Pro aminopeptidase
MRFWDGQVLRILQIGWWPGDQAATRLGRSFGTVLTSVGTPIREVEGEEQPLVPGMCFSVEPGAYLAGRFGVGIEDIVTATADGGRRLNTTDHGLRAVE